MAGDLIPPPSPAGRSEAPGQRTDEPHRPTGRRQWLSDAEPATRAEARAEIREDAGEPAPEPRLAPDSPFRPRFGFLFGALIGVVVAAVAVTVLLVRAGGTGVPDGWSHWKPSTSDRLEAAEQIAAHVAPKYRLQTGQQIVAVESGPLAIGGLPLEIALRDASNGVIQLLSGDGVMYTLNGLGARGSIASGTPSEARHLLLRREALELALYTFRYAKHVDMVVALLPPPPPKAGQTLAQAMREDPTQALLFRPGDLKAEVDAPTVRVTVPEDRTPRPETIGPEASRIQDLTRQNLFLAAFQQGQDAQAFLVLTRIPGG